MARKPGASFGGACGTNFAYSGFGKPRRYCEGCVPPVAAGKAASVAAWRALNPERVARHNERRRLGYRLRDCVDCGKEFRYAHASAIRCQDCRLERRLANVRRRYYGAKRPKKAAT